MERVLPKRLAVKPMRRRKKPFRYIPRDEQMRRKRQRLGIKHDEPIAADRQFILALKGLVTWRRLSRTIATTNNDSHR